MDQAELSQNISSTPKETRNKSKPKQTKKFLLVYSTGNMNFRVVTFWPCRVSSGLLWIVSMPAQRNCRLAREPNSTPLLENKQFWRQYPQDLCSYLETVFGYKRLHYTFDWHVFSKTSRCFGEYDFENLNILRNETFLSEKYLILFYLYYTPNSCIVNCSAVLNIDPCGFFNGQML